MDLTRAAEGKCRVRSNLGIFPLSHDPPHRKLIGHQLLTIYKAKFIFFNFLFQSKMPLSLNNVLHREVPNADELLRLGNISIHLVPWSIQSISSTEISVDEEGNVYNIVCASRTAFGFQKDICSRLGLASVTVLATNTMLISLDSKQDILAEIRELTTVVKEPGSL